MLTLGTLSVWGLILASLHGAGYVLAQWFIYYRAFQSAVSIPNFLVVSVVLVVLNPSQLVPLAGKPEKISTVSVIEHLLALLVTTLGPNSVVDSCIIVEVDRVMPGEAVVALKTVL
jgi:hypothetical protein